MDFKQVFCHVYKMPSDVLTNYVIYKFAKYLKINM